MAETTVRLVEQFQAGDASSADELFHRYVERLSRLARSRLSPRLARRVDPEDVVMSAYRSFFLGARDGRFVIQRSGDLWALLVRMTLHKLYRTAAFHRAEKRSIDVEDRTPASLNHIQSDEPTPEEAVALADFLEALLAELPAPHRRMLELRLQGERIPEIAIETGVTERTVRRVLERMRDRLGSAV